MNDWGNDLVAGIIGKTEEVMYQKVFIPLEVSTRDVLEWVSYMGRPIHQVLVFEDGFEIMFSIANEQLGRVLGRAKQVGMVIGGRQHYSPPKPKRKKTVDLAEQD